MNFGEKIKKLRTDLGWTQEFVANKLQISVPALSRYESGQYEPKSLSIISDFAKLYNVTTDYLLGLNVEYDTGLDNISVAFSSITEGLSKEQIDDVKRYIEFLKSKEK